MIVAPGPTFERVRHQLRMKLMGAPPVRTERWQGVAVNTDTFELRNAVFELDMNGVEDLDHWRSDIAPNLPWADDHFEERVGGEPINPGEQWKNWPWGRSAAGFRADKKGPELADHEWAYLAALIDGDGTINTSVHPYITIGQVDHDFLKSVQRRFNVGSIYPQKQRHTFLKSEAEIKELKTNEILLWKIGRADELKWVLSNLLRHIKLKRAKAKKAFDMIPDCDMRTVGNKGREPTFNHNYMQRLWPKYAGMTDGGFITPEIIERGDLRPRRGIYWEYGDLNDFVHLLANEPHTRQAWIPLFFPEDTGVADGGRKPCTLGYQLMVRDERLHIWYPLRSCDFIRHWPDDCYLAVRLMLLFGNCFPHRGLGRRAHF